MNQWRPRSDPMSTVTPSRSSRSCLRPTTSSRLRSGSHSTRRSRSLCSVACPRATEPYTRMLRAPCRRARSRTAACCSWRRLSRDTIRTSILPNLGGHCHLEQTQSWRSGVPPEASALLPPHRGAGVDHGNKAVVRVRCGRASGVGEQFAVQRGHELLDLQLHSAHLFAHVEDDLHAGEIDAEIACEVKDHLQAFQILRGTKAGVAFAARRQHPPLYPGGS